MSILENLEAYIASATAVNDDGVPSVSMALIDRSGALSSRVITNSGENSSTLYQACSISKAITSLAIAKLHDDGVISYRDRIVDHVPPALLLRLGKNEPSMKSVTVESLVSHRSGLSQHGFPGYSKSPRPTVEDIFLGRLPANTPRIRFNSFPLSQLSYSGGGFLLLQIYLEHVLHRPFHEIMQTLVLQPLGMARSTFADLSGNEQNYAKAYATAEMLGTTAPCGYHSFSELAAAGLWSTPTDLLKAVSAIQYSLHNEDGFLSKDTARLMLMNVAPNQSDLSMAMGWGSDNLHFGHAGDNDPGYNTYVFGSHGGVVNSTVRGASDPPPHLNNVAFAIMSNSSIGFPVIRKVISAVFYLDQWPAVPSLPGNFGSLRDFVPYLSSRVAPHDQSWKAWIGKWNDQWIVTDDEGSPKLSFRDQSNAVFLFPAAEAGNSKDGSKVESFVAEGYNIAVRLLQQDKRRCLEVVKSEKREVLDQQWPI